MRPTPAVGKNDSFTSHFNNDSEIKWGYFGYFFFRDAKQTFTNELIYIKFEQEQERIEQEVYFFFIYAYQRDMFLCSTELGGYVQMWYTGIFISGIYFLT